jgi:predicted DNA-binding transcriptional regulator YafY
MDRTERFYKIQDLLKQYKKLTMKQLQDSLGVSRATACRDLDYLRDRLGVPIVWDPKTKAYVLEMLGDSVDLRVKVTRDLHLNLTHPI